MKFKQQVHLLEKSPLLTPSQLLLTALLRWSCNFTIRNISIYV